MAEVLAGGRIQHETVHSLVEDGWHYICHPPRSHLYDAISDPVETVDRSAESAAVALDMRNSLSELAQGATHGRSTETGCVE